MDGLSKNNGQRDLPGQSDRDYAERQTLQDYYMDLLTRFSVQKLDDALCKESKLHLELLKNISPNTIDLEQFNSVIPEIMPSDCVRDTYVEERYVLDWADRIDDQLLVRRGDWFQYLYTLGFVFGEYPSTLKPILCINPADILQDSVEILLPESDSIVIPMASSGLCEHEFCPTVSIKKIKDNDCMYVKLDDERLIAMVRR